MLKKLIIVSFLFLNLVLIYCPESAHSFEVTAQGLSFSQVQGAVDEVKTAGEGTVYLPEGTSELWTETLHLHGGINLIGQGADKTIIRWDYDNGNGIKINEKSPRIYKGFRISGINFKGTYDSDNSNDNTGNSIYSIISMRSCPNFRIDNCIFEGGKYIIGIGNEIGEEPSTGVIDHCKIFRGHSSAYDTSYGISMGAREYIDEKELGTTDAVVVEDCILEDLGHPIGAFGGSHYVLRNSVIRYHHNKAAFPLDAHGPGYTFFNNVTRGTRAWEIYNNTFIGNPDASPLEWRAIGLRAGKGVIYNNNIKNFRHAVSFYCDPYTCNNGGLDRVNGAYIWGNTLENVTEGEILVQDNTDCTKEYIRRGVEFFTQPLENYTPLVYPHPLVAGSPIPPKNLTIIETKSN